MKPIAIYDRVTMQRLAFLENAYDISYEQQTNATWTGEFKLPRADSKKSYCQELNFAELWDIDGSGANKYVGLFRIIETIEESGIENNYILYTLEHVMTTLIESNIIGYLEYTTDTVAQVLTNILALQEEPRWVLNECDYTDVIEYEFTDTNLLSAINIITEALPEKYYWTFNTQIFPWEINLKKVSNIPITDIRYKKNIFQLTKIVDTRSLCTRLWIFGKEIDGAKVNISSVNSGLKYLDSITGIPEYGIISVIVNDDRFITPRKLYNRGVKLLNKLDQPIITYETSIEAIFDGANLKIGDTIRIITEDGFDDILVVQKITKDNLTASPNSGKITIGEGTVDIGVIKKRFI